MPTTYALPIIESVKLSWNKVYGAKGTFWIAFGIVILTLIILDLIQKGSMAMELPLITALIAFIAAIVQTLLNLGLLYIGLQRGRDKSIHFTQLKYSFTPSLALKLVILIILEYLILLPAMIVVFIGIMLHQSNDHPLAHLAGNILTLLGGIATLYLAFRLYLSKGIVLLKQLNPWHAVKLSFKATQHNVLRLIGFTLLSILILVISMVPLGIGLIWSLPYLFISYGVVYQKLFAGRSFA